MPKTKHNSESPMKNIKIKTTTTVKKQAEMTLTGDDILKLLHEAGYLDAHETGVGAVTFDVPGGGDWSNCTMNIDEETPIKIRVMWVEANDPD